MYKPMTEEEMKNYMFSMDKGKREAVNKLLSSFAELDEEQKRRVLGVALFITTGHSESIESRCRRALAQDGLVLKRNSEKMKDGGGYMIVDGEANTIVAGGHPDYDLDLLDVMRYCGGLLEAEAAAIEDIEAAGHVAAEE